MSINSTNLQFKTLTVLQEGFVKLANVFKEQFAKLIEAMNRVVAATIKTNSLFAKALVGLPVTQQGRHPKVNEILDVLGLLKPNSIPVGGIGGAATPLSGMGQALGIGNLDLGPMLKEAFGKAMSGITHVMDKPLKNMGANFKQLGPQMMMFAIAMQPVMSFMNGLLEPFSILSDLFEAFGETLGQAFVPVLLSVNEILMPFLPLFSSIAEILAPILVLVFQFMTPVGLILSLIQALTATFNNLLAPVGGMNGVFASLNGFVSEASANLSNFISGIPTFIGDLLANLIKGLLDLGGSIVNWINSDLRTFISDALTAFFDWIGGLFSGGGFDNNKDTWW